MMRLAGHNQLRFGFLLVLMVVPVLLFSVLRVKAATVGITVDVTTDTGGAGCELREAIRSANTEVAQPGCTFSVAPTAGADDFVITIDPTLFPAVISLNSELPAFQQPIHIIGGDVTVNDITIRPAVGLTLDYSLQLVNGSGDSQIEGLVIEGFTVGIEVVDVADNALLASNTQIGVPAGNGANKLIDNGTGILIRGASSDNIAIQNNLIGIDDAFTPLLAGNTQDGIHVLNASNIVIGGTGAGEGNIIGDNGRYGIFLENVDTAIIEGNMVGRTPIGGVLAAGNGASGIRIAGGSNDVLIDSNTIGSNGGNGILAGNATNTIISNNLIGEAIFATAAGNGSAGIWIASSGVEVTGNTITNNGGNGVTVASGNRNEISQNSINNNQALGIDLENDNVSANDTGDPDTGANTLLNYPVISAAWVTGGNLFIDGRFNSAPGNYSLELYHNSSCNPPTGSPLYGEGEIYDRTITRSPGAFSLNLAAGTFVPGEYLTILVIDSDGNTSEFSNCVLILAAAPTPTPTPTVPVVTTTVPPVTTTVPPVTTTVPPVTTTVPPVTTTVPPVTTTVPPVTTTVPPVTTTVPPVTTTVPPVTTTVPPVTTTVPPVTTTVPPVTTTVPPVTTTVPPVTTTVPPVTTVAPTDTPDIDITKVSDGEDDVEIDIINNGGNTAEDVIVIEDLRDNVEYRAATVGQQACIESAGLVTCNVGDVPAGATAQVNINVNGNGVDPASGQTTVIVGGAAVAMVNEPYIIKVANPLVAAPGEELTYTIRVINPTTESAFEMLIEDNMPEGIEIISGEATDGVLTIRGQNVQLRLDELVPNGRVTITLITRVSDADVFPEITNRACVNSSSNASPRCAQMSFLRAGQLPNTGEGSLFFGILRWGIVLVITGLMLAGLLLLRQRLRRV